MACAGYGKGATERVSHQLVILKGNQAKLHNTIYSSYNHERWKYLEIGGQRITGGLEDKSPTAGSAAEPSCQQFFCDFEANSKHFEAPYNG